MNSPNANDLIEWLQSVLLKQNVKNIIVNTVTKLGIGGGYGSDIVFVNVTGTDQMEQKQNYDLVVKSDQTLLKTRTMVFKTESSIYTKVIPTFNQFLSNKKITNLFTSLPKCYGDYKNENVHAIILENLKLRGYSLWDKKVPWIKENLKLVLGEYGKLHAISVSMAQENPDQFQELTNDLGDNFGKILEAAGLFPMVENLIEEVYNLLSGALNEEILQKWLALKKQLKYIFLDMTQNIDGVNVIIHGDCWSNNFLLKFEGQNKSVASEVAILDWQISSLSSPILDLSYFLFACISKADINSLDDILENYYSSFSEYLRILGSDPHLLYSKEQFLEDWRKYSKFGIVTCLIGLKASHSELNKETYKLDLSGDGKAIFKERVVGIVQYSAEQGLI